MVLAPSFLHLAVLQVDQGGTENALHVKAPVIVKFPVLHGYDCLLQGFRYVLQPDIICLPGAGLDGFFEEDGTAYSVKAGGLSVGWRVTVLSIDIFDAVPDFCAEISGGILYLDKHFVVRQVKICSPCYQKGKAENHCQQECPFNESFYFFYQHNNVLCLEYILVMM